jgi:hypothetical protein
MRFMVLVPATKESEAGVLPSAELLTEMHAYNQELVNAGVMLAADGLQPTAKGARVLFEGGKRTVTDGPFTESKELIAGYWIWEVRSREEALEWLKRAPFGKHESGPIAVELRQIFELTDLAAVDPTGELRAEAADLHAQIAKKK